MANRVETRWLLEGEFLSGCVVLVTEQFLSINPINMDDRFFVQLEQPQATTGSSTLFDRIRLDTKKQIDEQWDNMKKSIAADADTMVIEEELQSTPDLLRIEEPTTQNGDDLDKLNNKQLNAELAKLQKENKELWTENNRMYEFAFHRLQNK
ncbi:hypothetical protein M3Y94_00942900 [Aphelenchoides besseyi]|nr:hypothetical protein M3Y94_00942900 [Aphelenchoides besseyi]